VEPETHEDDAEALSMFFEAARTTVFSDGVIAIAGTLLVVDLKPPVLLHGQTLGGALLAQWPRYVAFVSSFAVISLIWIHHHRLFRMLRHTDNTLVNLNLLLMLAVLFIPFPTALLAAYPYERVSAVLYTSAVALNVLLFNVMWRHIRRRRRLLWSEVDDRVVKLVGVQYKIGLLTYLLLVVISFFSVRVSIAGNIILAVYYALPLHVIQRRLPRIARTA
jgi:uncharacterized membrane protein